MLSYKGFCWISLFEQIDYKTYSKTRKKNGQENPTRILILCFPICSKTACPNILFDLLEREFTWLSHGFSITPIYVISLFLLWVLLRQLRRSGLGIILEKKICVFCIIEMANTILRLWKIYANVLLSVRNCGHEGNLLSNSIVFTRR